MKSLNRWNRVAHAFSFILGYGWGSFAVLSGKVANVSLIAIAIGVVTATALFAYVLSAPGAECSDATNEPSEQKMQE